MAKIKIRNRLCFFGGITVIVLLIISYFIKVKIGSGFNYIAYTPLLGILIIHNPFILALYILIAVFLIFYGIRRVK